MASSSVTSDHAKWCRLCMSALNDTCSTSVSLFDEKDNTNQRHIVVDKLRQFVNLNVDPYDKLPNKVCQNCVVNLDFCIQFVDRCRRIAHLVQNEAAEMDYIQGQLNDHYPYLYRTSNISSEKNPQTVPFPHGGFFGRSTTVSTTSSKMKVRKILPKSSNKAAPLAKNDAPQITITNPAHVKAHSGQYMIPVTLMTPCKTCNAMIAATNVQDIQHHVCSNKSKNVNCSVPGCDKKFFTQITLRYHLKHYHKIGNDPEKSKPSVQATTNLQNPETAAASSKNSNTNRYFCSWPNCNKAYKAKTYMTEHYRTHTGDRPYSCSNCGKGFLRVLDMKKHKLLKVCLLNAK